MIELQPSVARFGKNGDDNAFRGKVIFREGLVKDDACWKAVMERDPAFNGAFVYAVGSTGIYCRPICPSRRPKRSAVSFFGSPAEAEAAGYRACRRCHPEDASRSNLHGAKILAACRYIEAREDRIPTLSEIGAQVGLSPHHLQRSFKRALGVTPRQYADAQRVERLKKQLQKGEGVTPALYDAGYGSSSRLYEKAPRQLGMTPATYRLGGPGEIIRYAIVKSTLGRLIVAGTARGICRVALARTAAELRSLLQQEFPKARLHRDDAGLRAWIQALVDYLNGELSLAQLPTDIQATAFQRRVWEVLQSIPRGETRSYADVARRIGQPRATRAVARACAANPVPLVIPCHRVIRADGKTGGYRLGVARKRALLAMEKAATGAGPTPGPSPVRPAVRKRPSEAR
jgi:AraC family transcriptional regulator of adaptative response/methylated-DNA-[protein]-cysteine methyltransferase